MRSQSKHPKITDLSDPESTMKGNHKSDYSVVISSGIGKFHMYHAVSAASEAGVLRKYFTTFYLKNPDSFLYKKLLNKIPNQRIARIKNRNLEGIDKEKVEELIIPEILDLLRRPINRILPSTTEYFNDFVARKYGKYVSKRLELCSIFHTRSAFSCFALEKARKLGCITLVDQSYENPESWDEILEEEYKKWRIPKNMRNFTPYASLMKEELESSDYILASSEFVKKTLVAKGIESSKILVVRLGVDKSGFKPAYNVRKKNAIFRILYVGGICIRKGIPYLLEAYKKAALPSSELILIGSIFPEMSGILKKYENLYKHISHVSHNELYKFYNDSSVFIIPTLSDGSSLVVDEALSSGSPVITTENNGNFPEDGMTGYVIPARDSDSIVESLSKLYKDRNLLNYMRENCLKKLDSVRSWQDYKRDLISVYEKLVFMNKI